MSNNKNDLTVDELLENIMFFREPELDGLLLEFGIDPDEAVERLRNRLPSASRPLSVGDPISGMLEACVLSDFALKPRPGLTLNGSNLSPLKAANTIMAFKVPLANLLARAGEKVLGAGSLVGHASIFVTESESAVISEVRIVFSQDAQMSELDGVIISIRDSSLGQCDIHLVSTERAFLIRPDNLRGPAKELRVTFCRQDEK